MASTSAKLLTKRLTSLSDRLELFLCPLKTDLLNLGSYLILPEIFWS